jgi:hypothetical protein
MGKIVYHISDRSQGHSYPVYEPSFAETVVGTIAVAVIIAAPLYGITKWGEYVAERVTPLKAEKAFVSETIEDKLK